MSGNPFRPGAGHQPPFLAGRQKEKEDLARLLGQRIITENVVLMGLRGMGKTVLMDRFREDAEQQGWGWIGSDMSEAASVSEDSLALRLLADLASITSSVSIPIKMAHPIGFIAREEARQQKLTYQVLLAYYQIQPGLVADKLRGLLEWIWSLLQAGYADRGGIVLAYDEAQNLTDRAERDQYPLSTLLDVFQSIQKKGIPFMLMLTGLPTLFPKMVRARTFVERMFHVITLERLPDREAREAVTRPLATNGAGVCFSNAVVDWIVGFAVGYPYFLQYLAKEVFDGLARGGGETDIASLFECAANKLDMDFFQARLQNIPDRQRDFLRVVAHIENCDAEFTCKQIVALSKTMLAQPFKPSRANQILQSLSDAGLVFKNRFGRYAFAVPLLGEFIRRQEGA